MNYIQDSAKTNAEKVDIALSLWYNESSLESYRRQGGTMGHRWPTVKEISKRTGYCREHLRRLIRIGAIKTERVGRVYLVDPESFAAYQERVAQHPHGGARGAVDE